MKLIKSLFLSLFLAIPVLGDELESIVITDFSPGLQTTVNSSRIENGAAQDLQNVDVWTGRIETRRGSVLQSSSTLGGYSALSVRLSHEFPDASNNFWLITASSATIFKSNDAGKNNTVLTSTHGFTTNSEYSAINAYSKVRLTDGTTNWVLFDGTNVEISTASPKGKLAVFFEERVWTADVAGDRSTLFYSRWGDPEDWTDNGTSDNDAGSEPIRKNNGYPIRAIVKYANGLIVFKDFSMDFISMSSDGLTPIRTPISSTIGTQYRQSIQVIDNVLIFLSFDGYYIYNGSQFIQIDRDIQPTVAQIKQLIATERTYNETAEGQFALGTSSGVATNISIGNVTLSTWTVTETTGTSWASGTMVYCDTDTITGSLTFNAGIWDGDFEKYDGASSTNTNYWTWGGNWERGVSTGSFKYHGNYAARNSNPSSTYEVYYINSSDVVVSTLSYTPTSTWTKRKAGIDYAGQSMKVRFTTGSENLTMTSTYTVVTSTIEWADARLGSYLYIDYVTNVATGSFVSQTFNTFLSSPAWLTTDANYSQQGGVIELETQSSNNGVSWNALKTWSPEDNIAPRSEYRPYIRYKVNFTTASGSDDHPYIKDITLAARNTSGRYISPSITLTDINSWKQFYGTKDDNGGTQTFELYTDTNTSVTFENGNAVASTFVSSQTILNGAFPTVSTNTYAYVGSTYTITLATQTPVMSDFTLIWNAGGANFPTASILYDGDYLCAVAIDSVSVNDTMLVYDRNGKWTKYKGPQPYSMTLYRQKPYLGQSLTGEIYRFQVDNLYKDGDNAISSYWTSKDFDYGYPIDEKVINRYNITGEYVEDSDAVFEYGANRGATTPTVLDLDSVTGFFRKTIKPSSLLYKKGITHRFKISNSDVDDKFSIWSVSLHPSLETSP